MLPADGTDWAGAVALFRRARRELPRLATVWADAAYRAVLDWAEAHCRWAVVIVGRRPGAVGFEVQPRRWIVERTFGRFGRYRRLSKDYERRPRNSATRIDVAMIHHMNRTMLPPRHRDEDLLRRPRRRFGLIRTAGRCL